MEQQANRMTVSFGAFSCTLEGFEDPFPVMKRIVEYFQDVSKNDPTFGLQAAFDAPVALSKMMKDDAGEDVTAAFNGSDLVISAEGAQSSETTSGDAGEELVQPDVLWDDYAVLDDEIDASDLSKELDAQKAEANHVEAARSEVEDAVSLDEDALAEVNGAATDAVALNDAGSDEADVDIAALDDADLDETDADKGEQNGATYALDEPQAQTESDPAAMSVEEADDMSVYENGATFVDAPLQLDEAVQAQGSDEAITEEETGEGVNAPMVLGEPVKVEADFEAPSEDLSVSGEERLAPSSDGFRLGFGGVPGLDASGIERVKTTDTDHERFADQGIDNGVFSEDGVRFDFDEALAAAEAEQAKATTLVLEEPVASETAAPVLQLVDPVPDAAPRESVAMPDGSMKSIREFASSAGAATLPELLEASAAYVTLVSGRQTFSRNELMTMMDEVPEGSDFSNEARIRTFSTMVNGGRIETDGTGKYLLSSEARAFYEKTVAR